MSRTPRFRIHTVAEMTGIPASTLRAWERRYGIPSPERTPSAYRLYSDEDVDLLRRMKCMCEGGIAPSEASRMLAPPAAAQPLNPQAVGDPYEEAVTRILQAVDAFDPALIRLEIARATYLGCASAVYEQVLGPVLQVVGQRWHEGRISVAQEHLASEILLGSVRDMHRLVQPEGERCVLLACVTSELHTLPLYGVAFRLASWGLRSEILGADTPPEALADAVAALNPSAVGLSATTIRPEGEMAQLLDGYARACDGRPWMVGGAAAARFAPLIEQRGGMVCAGELGAMRANLERALLVARREVGGVH